MVSLIPTYSAGLNSVMEADERAYMNELVSRMRSLKWIVERLTRRSASTRRVEQVPGPDQKRCSRYTHRH